MKSPARCVAWLLPFLLTGCFQLPFHKKHPAQARMLAPAFSRRSPLNSSHRAAARGSVIAANPIYNMREETQPITPPCGTGDRPNPEEAATAPEQTPPQPLP